MMAVNIGAIVVLAGVIYIVYWLGQQKTKICKQLYLGICGFLGIMGGLVMGFSRETLIQAVSTVTVQYELPNDDFMVWCVTAFDRFAMIAMIIAFLSILVAIFGVRLRQTGKLEILHQPTKIIVALQIFLVIASGAYSFNLMNAYFNVGVFITQFTYGAVALMTLGYIVDRLGKK